MGRNDDGISSWALPVIAILILIILVLLYPTIVQIIPTITNPVVNVTGNARAVGFTAVPDHVTFTGDGSPNTAAVSRGGTYAIMLQNGHVYNITLTWTAAGGLANGNCSAGSLNLHSDTPTLVYNISC